MHSIGCLHSHVEALFLGAGRLLKLKFRSLRSIAGWSSGLNCNLFCAVNNMGQRLMNDLAVRYFTSHAVYPPWVKIFQSSKSIADVEASSMKITSMDFEIMALLNTLCLVIVAMFVWCTSPRMGWNRLVLPLFASPIRHGTLALWHFLLKLRSFSKSSQNSPISTSERLFSKISVKYLGSGSLPGSYVVKALGEMMPIFLSGIGFFTKRLSLMDQKCPPLTSMRL